MLNISIDRRPFATCSLNGFPKQHVNLSQARKIKCLHGFRNIDASASAGKHGCTIAGCGLPFVEFIQVELFGRQAFASALLRNFIGPNLCPAQCVFYKNADVCFNLSKLFIKSCSSVALTVFAIRHCCSESGNVLIIMD